MDSNFKGQDPRGLVVYMMLDSWTGHMAEHHEALNHDHLVVTRTLEDPDVILDNTPTRRTVTRVANEMYVRYDAALSVHVLVPVLEVGEERYVHPHGYLAPGARRVITAYTDTQVPTAAVKWRKA